MVRSKFYEDKRKEELFGVWLDSHFYKHMLGKYKNITRNTDVALQKKGVDVIIDGLTQLMKAFLMLRLLQKLK